jgi:hypothetical protein
MKTEKLIYSMLTESTGSHFLDSGGTDGRMWQRNAQKTIEDFRNEDEESYEFDYDGGYLYRTCSVFHYLSCLELDYVCELFNEAQDKTDDEGGDIFYRVERGAERVLKGWGNIVYGREFNTYNGDSDLSQVLQGKFIDIDDEGYLLLQIHNGADVRGGYTKSKLFKLLDGGMIHEYLLEHDDGNENFCEDSTAKDYSDSEKIYTGTQVLARQYFLSVINNNDIGMRYNSYSPNI